MPGEERDRTWALPVIGVLAVVLAVVGVGAGLFVFSAGVGCACQPTPPPISADVDVEGTADGAAVTYVGGERVDHLLVDWTVVGDTNATAAAAATATTSSATPANASPVVASGGEDVSLEDGRARLLAPGATLSLSPANDSVTVRVEVTAIGERSSEIVVVRTVAL